MKPKDPIWNMYTLCEVGGKTVATCMDCETSVGAESDRLKNHKMKCGAAKKNTPQKRSLDTNDADENLTAPTSHEKGESSKSSR